MAATVVSVRARELSTRALCWQLPDGLAQAIAAAIAAALVQGTILSDYRFEMHKSAAAGDELQPKQLER